MTGLVLAGLALLFTAQGLDVPVTDHPTVRSEIKRGYEAGSSCGGYTMPANRLDPCVREMRDRYRSTHANTDAFEAGLSLRKWMLGAMYASLASSLPGNRLAQDYALYGKISASEGEADFKRLLGVLKITREQALEAAEIPASILPQ